MARITYYYNKETCRYEPMPVTGKTFLKKAFVFLTICTTLAIAVFVNFFEESVSLSSRLLERKNSMLKSDWNVLEKRISQASTQLSQIIEKDDHNYRVILDSQPLQAEIRDAGTGGSEKVNEEIVQFPKILSDYKKIDKLMRQLDIEKQSFNEIDKLLEEKIKMWASRPAIQPIDNRQLSRLHLTFGQRFHPIHHVWREHNGLDFTASKGTPVYATGDGTVNTVYYSTTYGKVIFIEHGHGYETRYAHLSDFNVVRGQEVKRGQIIGYVGNTGTSVSDHLHYEVLYKGRFINPINFFQRDLSNQEYEKLIEVGSQSTEPLD